MKKSLLVALWGCPELTETEDEVECQARRSFVKRYDQEFKRDAVTMLINSGRPLKQVAKELGVSDASLRDWRETYLEALEGRPAGGEGGPTPRDLVAENQRLRKELERVTWQRDILKKAASILSEKSPGGML